MTTETTRTEREMGLWTGAYLTAMEKGHMDAGPIANEALKHFREAFPNDPPAEAQETSDTPTPAKSSRKAKATPTPDPEVEA